MALRTFAAIRYFLLGCMDDISRWAQANERMAVWIASYPDGKRRGAAFQRGKREALEPTDWMQAKFKGIHNAGSLFWKLGGGIRSPGHPPGCQLRCLVKVSQIANMDGCFRCCGKNHCVLCVFSSVCLL